MLRFKRSQGVDHTPYSLDNLLRGAFAGIALLLLTVSLLGFWSTNRIQQPLITVTQTNLPEIQEIDTVRTDLLTQLSDDRQILFETNAAILDADLDLLPVMSRSCAIVTSNYKVGHKTHKNEPSLPVSTRRLPRGSPIRIGSTPISRNAPRTKPRTLSSYRQAREHFASRVG